MLAKTKYIRRVAAITLSIFGLVILAVTITGGTESFSGKYIGKIGGVGRQLQVLQLQPCDKGLSSFLHWLQCGATIDTVRTNTQSDAGPSELPALQIEPLENRMAFEFTVCSGGGGAHGVDFRSHVSIYSLQHSINGWVRNACNDCVYGMFEANLQVATTLAKILASPERVVKELASKASNLTTLVSVLTSYPGAACNVPTRYTQGGFWVDWSYAEHCSTPCNCRPTNYADCQQTSPLPTNVSYTKDCQRSPLGNSTKNFADCNSIQRDPLSNKSCFNISTGEIVPSGLCATIWVDQTYAATHCCGRKDASAPFGRQGLTIPPAPTECAAYTTDPAYLNKCPSKHKHGPYHHPLA